MELSAASLDNAIAKTAGLMRDELDVLPGDVVSIRLPLHWQRAVWWGACAALGAVFDPVIDPSRAAVLATDREHLDLAGLARDTVCVSLEPFGLPSHKPLPTEVIDHAIAARAHPDVFVPFIEPDDDGAIARAQRLAADRHVQPGDHVLVVPDDAQGDLLMLAVPLVMQGSAVLVRHPDRGDLDAVRLVERVAAR